MKSVQRREGTICDIQPNWVTVRIRQLSACTGCHAKEFCCSTDCAERLIRVQTSDAGFRIGDAVLVEGQDSLGRLAVLLSFILPILLLVISLAVALLWLETNELTAIGIAFGILGIYYLGLRLLDRRLRQVITFTISKLDQAS